METIDVTPTWSSLIKVFVAVIQDGTAEGKKNAIDELMKLARVVDSYNAKMPNGLDSWIETHYEVVDYLTATQGMIHTGMMSEKIIETDGRGGLYEKAEELTDEFEKLNKGRTWDGEFYDEITAFLEKKEQEFQPEKFVTGVRQIDEDDSKG